MAITATPVGDLPYYIQGNHKVTVTDITLGEVDYAAGGVAITAADLRLNAINHAEAQITVPSNADGALLGAEFVKDATGDVGGKIMLYDNVPAEPTDNDDVSATVVRVTATSY